ncbi:NAD+ synthase [Fluviibacter phosphoraccumulans]|uniref:NAD+ synthase n=1 Tax=Fluviibacter phosphoraccumulans TaxID=1751046 RepID=UPI0024E20E86|nr:NAD+ synthase [Fluviibacter phosphoraccumulans]
MRVAVAQMNVVLGDLAGNAHRIADAAKRACAQGADLLLTPELSLCGYPPEDLLLRPDFYRSVDLALVALTQDTVDLDIAIVVGHPEQAGDLYYNAASVLYQGKRLCTYRKQHLPQYEVFDELRYFTAGGETVVFDHAGTRFGLAICEDIWFAAPAQAAKAAGAEVLLVLNASPYHLDKTVDRQSVLAQRVAETGLSIVYCNLVGGQDELVFDGASCLLAADGETVLQLPQFAEDMATADLSDAGDWHTQAALTPLTELNAQIYNAMVLGVRDYFAKNGFAGAYLGLSGGIDSALTLCVAVDALGADRVRPIIMPSPYTAQMSIDDSWALCANLGVKGELVDIQPAMQTYENLLAPYFVGMAPDTTEENLQARIRGNLLMALSNKSGWLVLTTGNKSEMAVGYCTLYGDMAGGFAVLKDLLKTKVYDVSRWVNRAGEVIPWRIIERPPSAELRPDQTDQDSLPPYEVLDAIVTAYMEQDQSPREIIAQGYREADVRRVVRLLRISEYKRRQSPVGIRLTRRGFGKDWRYPITNRYADEW